MNKAYLALLLCAALAGCSDSGGAGSQDATQVDEDGSEQPDGAGEDGQADRSADDVDPDAPTEHACEAFSEGLTELMGQAEPAAEVADAPAVKVAAAELVVLDHERRVAELVVDGLDAVLADEDDPVHQFANGVVFLEGQLEAERQKLADLEGQIEAALGVVPDDAFDSIEGAYEVIDAVVWSEIRRRTDELLTRCDDARDTVDGEMVEQLMGDSARLVSDLHHGGHGVARRGVIDAILAEEGR